MSRQTKTALSMLGLVLVAGAFWLLLIAPKRDKANELSGQVSEASSSLATAKKRATVGLAAKKNFPHNYQQLVLLGNAVPADSGTASLLVQFNDIGIHHRTPFLGIELKAGEAEGEEGEAEADVTSLPPLGSSAGPAGLQSLPYDLSFEGGFFDTADFIEGVNSLVQTKNGRIYANGRLVTFDRFEMAATKSPLNPKELSVKFFATAYATPAGQGLTAGATPAGPAPE
jgi:Tfp pilus assembly protein PilO